MDRCGRRKKLAEFVSIYGIWLVAAFIALESVGIPLPAEAALIAAGFFAARTHDLDIWSLIAAGILAAILGEVVGFWIGRRVSATDEIWRSSRIHGRTHTNRSMAVRAIWRQVCLHCSLFAVSPQHGSRPCRHEFHGAA